MWEQAKPSNIANKPAWMNFDDAWVGNVAGLSLLPHVGVSEVLDTRRC